MEIWWLSLWTFVHRHVNVKYNIDFTDTLTVAVNWWKIWPAEFEETVLQQFLAIWGIAIIEVLS